MASERPTLPVHPESLPRSYPRDDQDGEREVARRLRVVSQARAKPGKSILVLHKFGCS